MPKEMSEREIGIREGISFCVEEFFGALPMTVAKELHEKTFEYLITLYFKEISNNV